MKKIKSLWSQIYPYGGFGARSFGKSAQNIIDELPPTKPSDWLWLIFVGLLLFGLGFLISLQ